MQAVSHTLRQFAGLAAHQEPASTSYAPARVVRPGTGRVSLQVEAAVLSKKERTQKRHRSIRHRVHGRTERPRLAVFRSNNHIYAQVIDDTEGSTLVAASTLTRDIREKLSSGGGGNKNAAELVGKKIAELCLAADIDKVCFDRGGYMYHGRIQALADAAREGGLAF